MLYRIIVFCSKIYFIIFNRIEVIGSNNIPRKGPFIIISNHISNKDAFIIAVSMKLKIAFMAKDTLFKFFIFRFFLKMLNIYPVDRKGDPRKTIKNMINLLKNKNIIALFPEGTRNFTSERLLAFKKGGALIACKSKSIILPAAIIGSNKGMFSKIIIKYGKPFVSEKLENKQNIDKINKIMENKVKNLLNSISYM